MLGDRYNKVGPPTYLFPMFYDGVPLCSLDWTCHYPPVSAFQGLGV